METNRQAADAPETKLSDAMADWAIIDSDPHLTTCASCRRTGVADEKCKARAAAEQAYQAAAHSMLRETIWNLAIAISRTPIDDDENDEPLGLTITDADKPWSTVHAGHVRFTVSLWFPAVKGYGYLRSSSTPSLDNPKLRVEIDAGYGHTRRFARKSIAKAAAFIVERHGEVQLRRDLAVRTERADARRKTLLAKVATATGMKLDGYDAQINDGKGMFLKINDYGTASITLNLTNAEFTHAKLVTILQAIQAVR